MTDGKVCAILKDKKGNSFPLIIAVTIAALLIFCGASEAIRLMIIVQGVRDALQSAVVSTVNDSYDDVYHGVREGYSGAYQPSAEEFEASLDYGDIYGQLDQLLGLMQKDGAHVKYAGSREEFRLYGLAVSLRNMPLAPSNPDNANGFLADAVIRLEVPVSFAGKSLPPLLMTLRVQAKYMPLF